jgi:hypothetical protein
VPFDTAGVAAAARAALDAGAEGIAQAVVEAAGRHRRVPATDDATLLVVCRVAEEPRLPPDALS